MDGGVTVSEAASLSSAWPQDLLHWMQVKKKKLKNGRKQNEIHPVFDQLNKKKGNKNVKAFMKPLVFCPKSYWDHILVSTAI